MAKYRAINTRVWNDNYIFNLDPSEKLVFIYLLTNEHTNISGIYEIPLRIISIETGIENDTIERIIKRFSKDNKIYYLDGWIIVKNFILHQILNPSVKCGIEREINSLPSGIIAKIKANKQIATSLGTVWGQTGLLNLNLTLTLTKPNNINITGTTVPAYGNNLINLLVDTLKGFQNIKTLDGSIKENRQYANLLINNKLNREITNKNATDEYKNGCFKRLLEKMTEFQRIKATSFKYLYYNFNSILKNK